MDISQLDDVKDQAVKRIHRIGSLDETHVSMWYTDIGIDTVMFGMQEKRRHGQEGIVRYYEEQDTSSKATFS